MLVLSSKERRAKDHYLQVCSVSLVSSSSSDDADCSYSCGTLLDVVLA